MGYLKILGFYDESAFLLAVVKIIIIHILTLQTEVMLKRHTVD